MLKWALGTSGHVAGLAFLEVAVAQSSPTDGQDGDPLKWSANCRQKTPTEALPAAGDVYGAYPALV